MNIEEFQQWLRVLAEQNGLAPQQAEDVTLQRRLFDQARDDIGAIYPGRVVGYVGGELVQADSVVELLDRVVATYRGERLVYFEPIGYTAFGDASLIR